MTKEHFEAIARIIAGDYAVATIPEKARVRAVAYSLADYFLSVNPRFDRAKFYKACGF